MASPGSRSGSAGGAWVAVVLALSACHHPPGGGAIADAAAFDGGIEAWQQPDLILEDFPKQPTCGNGLHDEGEQCDDRNAIDGDGCNRLCQIECFWDGVACHDQPLLPVVCGDGIRGSAEVCDDGNLAAADGCSTDCQTIEPGWSCPVPGRRCVPICGDRIVTGAESCDDGNVVDGDGCSARCTAEVPCVGAGGQAVPCPSSCGDGVIDGDEACDDGAGNRDGLYLGCTTDCRLGPYCGDGVTTAPEECDRGADNGPNYDTGVPGGACGATCRKPHFCGDGQVDAAFGEQCDLGGLNNQPVEVPDHKTCVICDGACQIVSEC